MNKNKKKLTVVQLVAIIFVVLFLFGIVVEILDEFDTNISNGTITSANASNKPFYSGTRTFKILSSQENEDLEDLIKKFASSKGYNIQIDYAGTLDIMQKLNSGEEYDGVWASNSIWLYMLNKSVSTSSSTSVSPVIFGITKSKAQELGFVDKDQIFMQDIVNAITSGNLKFSMSNPSSTNSGATAYLGMLQVLAGNPEVLKQENLDNEQLKEELRTLFSGMERSSGSDAFLVDAFTNGDYESVITYESSIIEINKKLIAAGKEPLYAIYPVDGVSLNDSPFGYLDNGDESKKEIYEALKDYLLSDDGQQDLASKGRRTWYGGINNNADKTVFNPDWGIDTTKYITPIKYPNTTVIKQALNMYQNELRKPVHVVFCLDYSGSMYGTGYNELINAMKYILGEKAKEDFIQFTDKDIVSIVPFTNIVYDEISTKDGYSFESMLLEIEAREPSGGTAIYPAAAKGIELLQNDDLEQYNLSVILMTDGMSNYGTYTELRNYYDYYGRNIPIYSIMFGEASESELEQIARLTNAKVFNGKQNLVEAFKEVRGYN